MEQKNTTLNTTDHFNNSVEKIINYHTFTIQKSFQVPKIWSIYLVVIN